MDSLHPVTKLYLAISLIVLSFFLEFTAQLLLLVALFTLVVASSQRRVIFKRLLRYVLPVVALIIFLNILLYPESPETVNVFSLELNKAGLAFGLEVAIRLLIISLSLLFFYATTSIHHLSIALLMKGVSPRIVYIFVHSFQLIETLKGKIQKIFIAQASRGLRTKGHPLKRIRAFFPMLLPLIFSYLSESLERGLALELRGLGIEGPKSFLTELRESRAEKFAGRISLIGTGFIIIWKLARWLIL